jgi:Family of unknown function (DUF6527)
MVKLHDSSTEPQNANATQKVFWFHCPGCECDHGIHVPQWSFNGSMDKPTFRPSLMCNRGTPTQCHSFITDGKIEFQGDCYHKLNGQTVELPDWEG